MDRKDWFERLKNVSPRFDMVMTVNTNRKVSIKGTNQSVILKRTEDIRFKNVDIGNIQNQP